MRDSSRFDPLHPHQPPTRWTRAGVTGIAFFLVTGLLWLLALAFIALMR